MQNVVWEGTAPPGGFGIDSRISAATPRAPAALRESSLPQAILKLHRSSSLDYRARHKLLVNGYLYVSEVFGDSFDNLHLNPKQ